ncbi:MAG: ABC transporter permease [Armatimonadetes bacterium]|nr:ABC transporter permease [Armatimonadota bacterium]
MKKPGAFYGLKSIVVKEWMHLKRDRTTLFIALLMPMLQLTIFGYAIDFDVRHIPTAVVDLDRSRESRTYLSKLAATGYLDIVSRPNSADQAADMVRAGDVKVVVTILSGFSRETLAGRPGPVGVMVDGSDSQVALRARSAFMSGSPAATSGVDPRLTVLYNPTSRTATFMIPGLMAVILQMVSVTLTAFSIVREKENGTLEQLMVTPVSRLGLMVGKILPYLGLAMVELGVVLVAANIVFDVPSKGSLIALTVMTLPFVFASLAIGLLISTVSKTQAQALQLVQLTLLPSILLSGYVAPRDTMPGWLYFVSAFFPATHYVQITRGIMVRGAYFMDLLTPFFALILLAMVLVLISARQFRKSLN